MAKILFVNQSPDTKLCAVFQWGKRTYNNIQHSAKHKFYYIECKSVVELFNTVEEHNIDVIIYNYFANYTLPWLTSQVINVVEEAGYTQVVVIHSEYLRMSFLPIIGSIKYTIWQDTLASYCPIQDPTHSFVFPVPRPLTVYDKPPAENIIPTFGSSGFVKEEFTEIIRLIEKDFDQSIIRFNIPFSHFADADGKAAMEIAGKCRASVMKPGTELKITHEFHDSRDGVLEFLNNNTLNIFLRDQGDGHDPGSASSVDDALSVRVPLAVNKSPLFRHLGDYSDICVDNNTLSEIIARGTKPLEQLYEKWSPINCMKRYEQIIDKITETP